jgi:uracil-DNA glycosylase
MLQRIYSMKRVIVIGQAPARPGSKHGVSGTYVRPWLYRLGVDDTTITEWFRFYALVGDFPGSDRGGHLRPSPEQIRQHQPTLIAAIQKFQPAIIVPVGGMAIAEVLPDATGNLSGIIGRTHETNPFGCLAGPIPTIPLPHPSGRSTWLHQHNHLFNQALTALKLQLELPSRRNFTQTD